MMKRLGQLLSSFLLLLVSLTTHAVPGERVTYYHNDVSGSPVAATDANGNLLWTESYQPYGAKVQNSVSTAAQPIAYTGKVYDDTTGLSYFGARYYDPVLGRFTGMDAQGFDPANIHSFNRYAYGNNNPYRYVDPDGNAPTEWWMISIDAASLTVHTTGGDWGGAAMDVVNIGADAVGPPGVSEALHVLELGHMAAELTEGDAGGGGPPDFIVSRDGAVIHNSIDKVRESLKNAGFPGADSRTEKYDEPGTIHNIPDMKMDVRVMEGSPNHRPRVVASRQGTRQPVNPANGSNFGNVPRNEQRARSHIEFQ